MTKPKPQPTDLDAAKDAIWGATVPTIAGPITATEKGGTVVVQDANGRLFWMPVEAYEALVAKAKKVTP